MGGEDFAFMLEERPGAYILVGNGDTAMVHHPGIRLQRRSHSGGLFVVRGSGRTADARGLIQGDWRCGAPACAGRPARRPFRGFGPKRLVDAVYAVRFVCVR